MCVQRMYCEAVSAALEKRQFRHELDNTMLDIVLEILQDATFLAGSLLDGTLVAHPSGAKPPEGQPPAYTYS